MLPSYLGIISEAIITPKDPCREYLLTFPLECGHFSPNVGKKNIHTWILWVLIRIKQSIYWKVREVVGEMIWASSQLVANQPTPPKVPFPEIRV